jgi:hypothetical protein
MRFLRKVSFPMVVLMLLVLPACVYDEYGNPVAPGGNCSPGFCYIRSANTCCPNGYLNYANGKGCYANRTDCLNAGGGKCYWETSCYP